MCPNNLVSSNNSACADIRYNCTERQQKQADGKMFEKNREQIHGTFCLENVYVVDLFCKINRSCHVQ